jgi:hypothetical protein
MSFLGNLFGGDAEKEAAEKNRAQYDNLQTQGSNLLTQGYNTGVGNLNSALGAYQPLNDLASKYGGASTMLLNALGVNGATGSQAAQSAFTNNPGYTSGLDAGLDAINRRRAASGMLASGNADQDAQTFGQNLQNQQYNSWLTNLAGFTNPELAATSGAATGTAGVYGDLASLANNNATNQVNLLGQTTAGQVGANNLQAQGEAAGAKNLLGLGTSLLGLGTGGGSTVGGSLLSGLGSLFSDRRLKSNIRRIGTAHNGLPLYEYTIFGQRQRGVMADEAEKVMPAAVTTHPSGFKMVNYAMLGLL